VSGTYPEFWRIRLPIHLRAQTVAGSPPYNRQIPRRLPNPQGAVRPILSHGPLPRFTCEFMGGMMRPVSRIVRWASIVALTMVAVSTAISGERARIRRSPDPQRMNAAAGYPGAAVDPTPLPGRIPYWGQALGGTYYNWGYFGANQQHPQYISHAGYYGEYYQFGYTKGY
jgi:hypothetical protein